MTAELSQLPLDDRTRYAEELYDAANYVAVTIYRLETDGPGVRHFPRVLRALAKHMAEAEEISTARETADDVFAVARCTDAAVDLVRRLAAGYRSASR